MTDRQRHETKDASALLRAYLATLRPRLVAAEILFVAGWSLMWATSLRLVPFVPTAVWLALIACGLLLASVTPRRT